MPSNNIVKEYSNSSILLRDLELWVAWKNNLPLNLSYFPKLAEDRWEWIVYNWNKVYYPKFKEFSNGNGYLENSLVYFNNNIYGWLNGTGVNPLSNPDFYVKVQDFLLLISIQEMFLTVSENLYITEEIKKVSEYTSENFKAMTRFLRSSRDGIFDRVGLGDEFFSQSRGRTTLKALRDVSVDDLEYASYLANLENFVLGIILDFRNLKEHAPNLLEFAQKELGASSISLNTTYKSFIEVPFERNLEQMAKNYLGSADSWYELVTVNNLKPPYVDRNGTKEPLLETGAGATVRVNLSYPDRLRIGKTVKIGSQTLPEEIRRIEGVTDNNDGTATILLDGEPNLYRFKKIHSPYLRIFKPETIQEFSFVKIPFNFNPGTSNSPEPELQVLKDLDKALYNFGVDLAINENNEDLRISQNGDLSFIYGIPAVRQAVWSVLRTEYGQLPYHQTYGIKQNLGENMFGPVTVSTAMQFIQDAVNRDARFTSVNISDITFGDKEAAMRVNAKIEGSQTLIPFSFAL